MYYESRTQKIMEPCINYTELAEKIGSEPSHHVQTIINANGQRIAFVPDGPIDDMTLELAIINLDTSQQIESLTWGWVEHNKVAILKAISVTDYIMKENVTLNDVKAEVNFTCGSCGIPFKSTIEEQAPFDQDAGFGYCEKCC